MTGCEFLHEEDFYVEKSDEPFAEGGFVIHTEIAPYSASKARATIRKIVKSYNEYEKLKAKEKQFDKILKLFMKSNPITIKLEAS